MTSYSTVLFDLDGTLTDPKVGITKSVQYALFKFGVNEPDLERLTSFIGPPLTLSFQQKYHFSAVEAKQAVEHYRAYFTTKGMYENVVYERIPWLLKSLKDGSKNLAVATSKPTVFAQEILDHFGIGQFFDHVVGSNLDGTRSDKTEIIEYAMMLYSGWQKSDFIMIGDREFDMIGANRNGIDSIGVTYGYGSREELTQAKATYVADTIDELMKLLRD